MKHRPRFSFFARAASAGCALVFAGSAAAAQVAWTGGDGAWENPANWSGLLVPQATDLATIDHTGLVTSGAAGNVAAQLETYAALGLTAGDLTVSGTIELYGRLDVADGTRLGAGRIVVHAGGVLAGDGPTAAVAVEHGIYNSGGLSIDHGVALSADSIDNFVDTQIAGGATGHINSMVNHAGATFGARRTGSRLDVSGNVDNQGSMIVQDGAAAHAESIVNHGSLTAGGASLGANSLVNESHLEVNDGGDLQVDDITTNKGTIEVKSGGSAHFGNLDNRATLMAHDATLTGGDIDNGPAGTVELVAGTTVTLDGRMINRNQLDIGDSANLDSERFQQFAGHTTLAGGTLGARGAFGAQFAAGDLSGDGTIEGTLIFTLDGRVAPGATAGAAGAFTVHGAIAWLGGTYAVDLRGTTATAYDRIVADGAVALGGRLEVALGGGFTPVAGDSFDILSGSAITGDFASLLLPTLAPGLRFDLSTTGGALRLSVSSVPLPTGLWLVLPPALGLLRRRREVHRAPR